MPLFYLIVLIHIVGFVSIYLDRRFIRNRTVAPKAQEEENGPN